MINLKNDNINNKNSKKNAIIINRIKTLKNKNVLNKKMMIIIIIIIMIIKILIIVKTK